MAGNASVGNGWPISKRLAGDSGAWAEALEAVMVIVNKTDDVARSKFGPVIGVSESADGLLVVSMIEASKIR